MSADPQRSLHEAGVAVSEDRLLDGRVRLRQPTQGYRVAIDPVILAASVSALDGQSVLDLGCGVGAAGLCLLARVPDLRVVGLDLQGELVRLAGENAMANGMTGRFLPMTGDITRPPLRLAPSSFHHVICNPPHLAAAQGRPSGSRSRDLANREGGTNLADWVATALAMVQSKGSITLVHRADRLDDLLAALSGRAGEIVVFPLWPGGGRPAKRVLLRARKDVATPLRLAPGLLLHGDDGRFTAEAEAILRDGRPLDL